MNRVEKLIAHINEQMEAARKDDDDFYETVATVTFGDDAKPSVEWGEINKIPKEMYDKRVTEKRG